MSEQVEQGTIADITPHNHNANKGTQRGRGVIEHSLRTYGAGRSILLDKNKRNIAGNHVAEVAGDIGIEDVIFVHTTGNKLVAVVRDDMDLDTVEGQAMAISDNRASELGLDWSPDVLAELQPTGTLDKLFRADEIEALLKGLGSEQDAEGKPALTSADVPNALFPTDNEWGVPLLDIKKQATALDMPITKWGVIARTSKVGGTVHFYTDDYKFAALWDDPTPVVNSRVVNAIEPNFSTLDNMPRAVALWRVYQKRWLARFWQEYGVRVFVDLNVMPQFRDLNLLGVPKGWRAYATRGLMQYFDLIEQDYNTACEHAGSEDILFVVVGGGDAIKRLCHEHGWIHVYEGYSIANNRKGGETNG